MIQWSDDSMIQFPNDSIQSYPFGIVIARHVRKNHRVAFVQPFDHLNGIHRRAPNFHRNANPAFAVWIKLEQTDRAVLFSESWPPDVKDVVESFQIHGAVYAQIGTR